MSAGVRSAFFTPVTVGSLAIGLILLGLGITMVIASALGLGRSAGSSAARDVGAIPHYVALSFLWVALIASTLVAAAAILITGHYPRPLIHFNVGVLRWTWRVAFHSYGALGTDRYPPFTLTRTDYPANFDVTYPEHLSRGLVLIKSWHLALRIWSSWPC